MSDSSFAPASRWATSRAILITLAVALSTYYLRRVLAPIGLQGLTFMVPVLVAGYVFGSTFAAFGGVMSLAVAHLIIWRENPDVLFTRGYFSGIVNFAFLSGLVVFYGRRHETVLRRLDSSLARESAARADAEQANRLKDQFLATLSHELRTPINVILGYVRPLLNGATENPTRALEVVNRNAEQQARLIEEMLDASRIITGTFRVNSEQISARTLLREAVDAIQPAVMAKGLDLELIETNREAVILGDALRLRQVFWNLLSNAVKFTPAGGRISVRMTVDDREVVIAFRDTGRGIATDFLPHVFEMFRQADASTTRDVAGLGLGLALVKHFVELQGGRVTVESAGIGHGATFTCRFPLYLRVAHERASGPGVTFLSAPSTIPVTPLE